MPTIASPRRSYVNRSVGTPVRPRERVPQKRQVPPYVERAQVRHGLNRGPFGEVRQA